MEKSFIDDYIEEERKYEATLIDSLIESDFQTIFSSPSGMAYLYDILSEVYSSLDIIQLEEELMERKAFRGEPNEDL